MPAQVYELCPGGDRELVDIIYPSQLMPFKSASLEDAKGQPVAIMCDISDLYTAIYACEEEVEVENAEAGESINFSLIGKLAIIYHKDVLQLPVDTESGDRHTLLIAHRNFWTPKQG